MQDNPKVVSSCRKKGYHSSIVHINFVLETVRFAPDRFSKSCFNVSPQDLLKCTFPLFTKQVVNDLAMFGTIGIHIDSNTTVSLSIHRYIHYMHLKQLTTQWSKISVVIASVYISFNFLNKFKHFNVTIRLQLYKNRVGK